jgi:Na+-driven multidrug efflux pump
MACNQVTGDILRGRKRPLAVARAQGLAAIFTVILLIILLPAAGVYGAAIASAVAYGVALAMMLLSLRSLPSNNFEPGHRKASSSFRQAPGSAVMPAAINEKPA